MRAFHRFSAFFHRVWMFGLALGLTGCFSLKTQLPELKYYDLDFSSEAQSCSAYRRIALSEIRSLPLYDTHALRLKKRDGEMVDIPHMAWVDMPKNLLKKLLIGTFDRHCILASLPPFGGIKNDSLLKVELLNFEFVQRVGGEFAQVSFFYELSNFKDFTILQSGVISEQEEVKEGYVEAFQKALGQAIAQLIEKLEDK